MTPASADLVVGLWLAAALYATPLVFASVGEVLSERAGVLNLGLEGILAAGALAGYGVSAQTGSAWLGLAAGAAAGLLLGSVHGLFSVALQGDPIVAGQGLTLAATGAAAAVGPRWLAGAPAPAFLSELSAASPRLLLGYPPTTYAAAATALAASWLLERTRAGLALRAAGDAPEAARELGLSVRRLRWLSLLAGSALTGFGGACLPLAYAHTWTSTMPGGLGWIAVALVPLSGWRPVRAAGLSLLLGLAMALQLRFQILGVRIASSLLEMLPYLVTLVVLVAGKVRRGGRAARLEPRALGRPVE